MYFKNLFLFIFITGIVSSYAQTKKVKCFFVDEYGIKKKNIPIKYCQNIDSFAVNLQKEYISKGFSEFSVDSIVNQNSEIIFYIHKGEKYKIAEIHFSPDEFNFISKKYFFKPLFTPEKIQKKDSFFYIKIQNLGYPFASFTKHVDFIQNKAFINCKITTANFVIFDTIKTSSEKLISYNYLSKTTGIISGKPYSTTLANKIKRNINNTGLFILDSAYIKITNNKCKVILKLKKNKQNSFSGLIGIQQDKNKKTILTGNISLSLNNAFSAGEKILFKWGKPDNMSQMLNADFYYPYIFKLPTGMVLNINLFKQDTLFTNSKFAGGITVPFINAGELSVNGKWLNSSAANHSDQNINSTKSKMFGIGYLFSKSDNLYISKKEFCVKTKVFMGDNTIINTTLPNTKNISAEWNGNLNITVPVKSNSINIKNNWALMKNDSAKINNLYRLGGINDIRGFNENSIYTKSYYYLNTEYRFFLNKESYMYLLYDCGFFYEPDKLNLYKNIFRQSIGGGITLKTKAGILSIIYAVGKTENTVFKADKGQIHIGYINRF
jgi:hypothetical protein